MAIYDDTSSEGAERVSGEGHDDGHAREFFNKYDVKNHLENEGQLPPGQEVGASRARRGHVEKPGDVSDEMRQEMASVPDALADELPMPAPMLRGGRPSVVTAELQQQVCMLLSIGLSRRQAAAYLNIDQSTISHVAARDEEFTYSMQRAEELSTVQPLLALIGESRKNWRAAAWLLTHRQKQRKVLTEEEKDQRHQRRLADAQRKADLQLQSAVMREVAHEQQQELRRERESKRRQAENDLMYPRHRKRKKKVDEASDASATS